jgi:hypothetical protein
MLSSKGHLQPKQPRVFLTQCFHIVIEVLTGDKFPGAQESVAHCNGRLFNRAGIQETLIRCGGPRRLFSKMDKARDSHRDPMGKGSVRTG